MGARKLRILKVGTLVYFWRVHHRHEVGALACTEVFTAFLAGFRGSPLRILFPESDQHGPGFPRQAGVIVDRELPSWQLNLNRPKSARAMIELAAAAGWAPNVSRHEFVIDNGFEFLRGHRAALEDSLLADRSKAPATP